MSIYGRVISDDMVEDSVLAVLQKWMDTELRILEEQLGLSVPASGTKFYQRPRTWAVHNEFDNLPEESLPAIIVVSIGLDEAPTKDGRKKYRAYWNVGVGAIASAGGDDAQMKSRRFAYRLGAAARASLVHRQSLDGALGGTVEGVDWIDGRNNEVASDMNRTLWATRQVFRVTIADVLTQSAGPNQPDADPPGPTDPIPPAWDTIPDREHIHTTVTQTKEDLPE